MEYVLSAAVLVMLFSRAASAATYDVGNGYPYPRLSNLPALAAGDLVQIHSGTYNEVKRWTQSGTASAPITIRGVGATLPVIDASGLPVDGAMPNPRAAFQIEGAYVVIENFELKNARNGNNGAGIRVTGGGNNATVRNCVIYNCDMGMMSDSSDNLLVESCEVAYNGTSAFAGYSHNFYLSGNRVTVRYCYIHDALQGQNFKTRGHYTELLYNYIADSSDGEVVLVDSSLTTTANSNAVMIGNIVVSKDRGPQWNVAKFVQFGQDGGNAHTGTLYAFNNTFIAGTNRINFLDANASGSSIVASNNIFYGSATIASGTISGSNNWAMSGAAVPSGLTNTTFNSSPGFSNLTGRDFHLSAGSSCVNIGAATLTCRDGAGSAFSGVPTREYVNHLRSNARASSGSLDAGAYEYASAVVAPSITAQPANQTVTAGQSATFSVSASGTAPLAYQWQKNSANISGATAASYTTPATTTADSGSLFRCAVSNSTGSATSNAATLTVNSAAVAPSITAQPANQTVTAGQSATFSVSASGTAPLSYQWQKNSANISGATAASYTTPVTTMADSGSLFRCIVSNSVGSATSNAATLTVNGGGGFIGNGTGLNAEYYDNMDFTGTKITRVDSTVNFDWGSGSPNAAIAADSFSARWSGQVQAKFSEAVTFYTFSDDGVRLWVNGQLVIDNWTDHGPTENASAPLALSAGVKYSIKLEFYENGGGATAKLLWSSASEPKGTVPQSQLYPASNPVNGNGTGLAGQYFDNVDFTIQKLTRVDSTVNFDWGGGPPDASMGADLFSVRWTGQVQPRFSETFTFYTVSDDGIRLWVNGQQIINNWTDHGPTENSGTIALSAGQKYDIKLEFYENGGGAVSQLLWSSVSEQKAVVPQSQLYPATTPVVGNGTGLSGQYFDNADFTNLKLTRTDATVNFDWGSGSPDVSTGADTFSVRWTGQVQPKYSQTYTFYTVSDDGIRLWVNGQQLINNWTDHGPTENSGTIALSAGQKYDIKLEFYENGGGAVAKLLWSCASEPKAVIPQSQLYPVAAPQSAILAAEATAPADEDNDGLLIDYELSVGLNPQNADSDANGIPDGNELTSGGLTQLQAQEIWLAQKNGSDGTIQNAKLKAGVQFSSVGKDSLAMTGTLPSAQAPGADSIVILEVGGVASAFKINAKGSARSAAGRFSLVRSANKPAVFKAQLKGALAMTWIENGIVANLDETNSARVVPVKLIYAGKSYAASVTVRVSARKDRGARLKN